jgi:hypothetical protein
MEEICFYGIFFLRNSLFFKLLTWAQEGVRDGASDPALRIFLEGIRHF